MCVRCAWQCVSDVLGNVCQVCLAMWVMCAWQCVSDVLGIASQVCLAMCVRCAWHCVSGVLGIVCQVCFVLCVRCAWHCVSGVLDNVCQVCLALCVRCAWQWGYVWDHKAQQQLLTKSTIGAKRRFYIVSLNNKVCKDGNKGAKCVNVWIRQLCFLYTTNYLKNHTI